MKSKEDAELLRLARTGVFGNWSSCSGGGEGGRVSTHWGSLGLCSGPPVKSLEAPFLLVKGIRVLWGVASSDMEFLYF